MNQNNFMRFKTARIISDLRNGFCVCLVENARKTFFFCRNTIHPETLATLQHYNIITTKEWYNHHYNANAKSNVVLNADFTFQRNTTPLEDIALQITKTAELQPIIISTETEPQVPFETVDINDLSFDIKSFRYEITLMAKSKIQLHNAPNSEIYAFSSKFGGHEHYAILINDPLKEASPLVRIHSSCYTGDLLASLRCDCRDQLQESIALMNKTSGILLYIMQEGRGIGLANKILAYNYQQEQNLDTVESNFAVGFKDDERSFLPAFTILQHLGKKSIRLVTNNPKKANDLTQFGIDVTETVPTYFSPHEHNQEYLQVKKDKMGHVIDM